MHRLMMLTVQKFALPLRTVVPATRTFASAVPPKLWSLGKLNHVAIAVANLGRFFLRCIH
jgi:hypothetical protein